jgi:hypothetical protein
MKRLNALTLLGVGIFAGGTGSYWLAQRGEPTTTPAPSGSLSLPRSIGRFSITATLWATPTPRRCRRRTRCGL